MTAPRSLEWISEELPPPGPDEVLVETIAGAISIGSELPQYRGTARSSRPMAYPKMTGYENVSRVLACGSAVTQVREGDRIVAFYGHRTHAILAEARAILVPQAISDELALLAILTCDVAKGIRKVNPKPDEAVLVTGAGAIGLMTVFMLKAMGVQRADVVEPRAERRRLAERIGAHAAFPPEQPPEQSYSVGIECSSRDAAFRLLQERMARGGRVCILADGNIEPLALAPAFHEKELLVVGSSDGEDYPAHARWYFEVVQEDSRGLEQLFDYRTTAEALPQTFERLATGETAPVKVLVQYRSAPA